MVRFLFRLVLGAIIVVALAIGWFRMAATAREDQPAENLLTETSRLVETVHGRMHVMTAGPNDGIPVLLIHGSVGWAGLWSDTMTYLADRGFKAMAIDLPPMGLSDRDARSDYSRQAQGLRILAFAEAEGIKPIVVSHSFGAGAAFEAMMAAPDDFRGAVVIAGALSLGQDGTGMTLPAPLRSRQIREATIASTVTNPYLTRWLFKLFVHRKDSITDAVVDALEYPFTRAGTTEALAQWLPTLILPPRGAASSDPANYAALEMPIALIWGREDVVTPPNEAEALSAALDAAPIFWLGNTGHIPQIEAPQAFHETLVNALAVIAAGG